LRRGRARPGGRGRAARVLLVVACVGWPGGVRLPGLVLLRRAL